MFEAQNRAQQWALINRIVQANMTVREENEAVIAILKEQCRTGPQPSRIRKFMRFLTAAHIRWTRIDPRDMHGRVDEPMRSALKVRVDAAVAAVSDELLRSAVSHVIGVDLVTPGNDTAITGSSVSVTASAQITTSTSTPAATAATLDDTTPPEATARRRATNAPQRTNMYEARNRAQQWMRIHSAVRANMTTQEENEAVIPILEEQCRFDTHRIEVCAFMSSLQQPWTGIDPRDMHGGVDETKRLALKDQVDAVTIPGLGEHLRTALSQAIGVDLMTPGSSSAHPLNAAALPIPPVPQVQALTTTASNVLAVATRTLPPVQTQLQINSMPVPSADGNSDTSTGSTLRQPPVHTPDSAVPPSRPADPRARGRAQSQSIDDAAPTRRRLYACELRRLRAELSERLIDGDLRNIAEFFDHLDRRKRSWGDMRSSLESPAAFEVREAVELCVAETGNAGLRDSMERAYGIRFTDIVTLDTMLTVGPDPWTD